MKKQDIRKYAFNFRKNLSKEIKKVKDEKILSALMQHKAYINAKIIGVFYPFNAEIDIKALKHEHAEFAYPKMVNNNIVFITVNNLTKWEINSFGINEPVSGKIVSDEIDLLIVPALAINESNFRVGYGKGYYDKFILKHQPKYTIGIIYDELKLPFNEDKWDIPLDEVISY